MMSPKEYVEQLVQGKTPIQEAASAFAPANVALCKYWGKENSRLNLAYTPSLSLALGSRGSQVQLRVGTQDRLFKNDEPVCPTTLTFQRTFRFLRLLTATPLEVFSQSNLPIGAGLASSSSYFAALILACNDLLGWRASRTTLSCLARLGSGSACRSLWSGFVRWLPHKNPLYSHGMPLEICWPDLQIGLWIVNTQEKTTPSREGMQHTVRTSCLYPGWCRQTHKDYKALLAAVQRYDFKTMGAVMEANALMMHGLLLTARPPLWYGQSETWAGYNQIHALRRDGVSVYATQDAGPNLKLFFLENEKRAVLEVFPQLEVIAPFKQT